MNRALYPLYAMHSLQGLAGSLVGIFVPIYLLRLGYSLREVLLFYLALSIVAFLSFFASNYVSRRVSLRSVILISYAALFTYIAVLLSLQNFRLSLSLVALAQGMHIASYWFSLHVLFAERAEDHTMGRSVGRLFAFPKFASVLAPLAGASIGAIFGFGSLISSAAFVYLISLIPLFFVREFPRPREFRISKLVEFLKKYPRYFAVEFADVTRAEVESVIWPIFIFLTFQNIFSVGWVGSLSAAGSAFFTMAVGSYSDKINNASIIKIGAAAMLMIWAARFFAESELVFYVLTLLAGFFTALIAVPWTSTIYTLARENNIREFIVFREIPITLARISIYSLAALFILNIKLSFLVAAASALIYFLYKK